MPVRLEREQTDIMQSSGRQGRGMGDRLLRRGPEANLEGCKAGSADGLEPEGRLRQADQRWADLLVPNFHQCSV